MLSDATLDLIDQSLPALEANAERITRHFYQIMFRDFPEVRPLFNQSHQQAGTQARALANSVLAYGRHIRQLQVLEGAVERIVHKHVAVQVQPEHYPIVGQCLLQAIRDVLGDAATDAIVGAWAEAYQQLADLLITAEESLYQSKADEPGGWRGRRRFTITRKELESSVITSLYLQPEDGGALPDFKPGQYLTVFATVDGEELRRNYSLSDAPGQPHLRISVKREGDGKVSNFLHRQLNEGDSLELGPPVGDFVLKDSTRPLVLATGGVGITPAISMLNACVDSGREIIFIHAALNSRVHAFRRHVEELALSHPNLTVKFIYNDPLANDHPHAKGLINSERLQQWLPADRNVDFYFLGPKPFMRTCWQLARELGIPESQVAYEFFGPLEDLEGGQEEAAA